MKSDRSLNGRGILWLLPVAKRSPVTATSRKPSTRRFLSPHVTTKRKKSYVKKRERVGEV